MTHDERWELALQIASQIQRHYGDQLVALGIYGSLARSTDGPFSDIEMHCIIRGEGVDECLEWSAGPWKAEVDVVSPEVILADAESLDGDWAVTHGAFVYVEPIYDPDGFFPTLSQMVFAHSDSAYKLRMEEVIVGEIYELVGKVRNAVNRQAISSLPVYAVKLATFAACLHGLYHRRLYTSSETMFTESLALPDSPAGFQELCQMVTSGKLDDPFKISDSTDRYWNGLEAWAASRGYCIKTSLQVLLESSRESGDQL